MLPVPIDKIDKIDKAITEKTATANCRDIKKPVNGVDLAFLELTKGTVYC